MIWSATSWGAIAHSAETLLTGENVRSYPATALVDWRELRAMNEDSSRGLPGGPAVLLGEHGPTDVGADPGPLRGRQRGVPGGPEGGVRRDSAAGDLDPERRRGVENVVRPAQLGGGPGGPQVRRGAAQRHHLGADRVSVRVQALGEQGSHLLLGDQLPDLHVHLGQSGPQPGARGLTLLGVVVPETGVPAVRVIERSDLPGQVRVPVPGGQLVNRLHT